MGRETVEAFAHTGAHIAIIGPDDSPGPRPGESLDFYETPMASSVKIRARPPSSSLGCGSLAPGISSEELAFGLVSCSSHDQQA
jgi:hypothetical protein